MDITFKLGSLFYSLLIIDSKSKSKSSSASSAATYPSRSFFNSSASSSNNCSVSIVSAFSIISVKLPFKFFSSIGFNI